MNINIDKNASSTADQMDTTMTREEVLREKVERLRDGATSLDDMRLLKMELRQAGMLDEAIEVSDMIMEEQLKTIAEAKKTILGNKDVLEKMIRHVYRKDGQPSCPLLELNSTVEPSIEHHQLNGIGKQCVTYVDENGTPVTYEDEDGNEITAKICIADGAPWDRLKDLVVPTQIRKPNYEHDQEIPSNFSRSETLEYQNEIKVQFHVQNMVLDAIRCLGYEGVLSSDLEISMYGLALDIIIVNVEKYKIVFVVEVKAPDKAPKDGEEEKIEGKVCHHPKTGYQVWLYLQALKSLGVPFPIGAICTFNEFRLVWLPPSAIDGQKPPFSTALDKLTMGISTLYKAEQPRKLPASPSSKRIKASDASNEHDTEQLEKMFKEECKLNNDGVYVFVKPRLCGGPVVHTIDVFPQLLLGLQAAIDVNFGDNNISDSALTVEVGDKLASRCYVYVSPDNVTRGFTPTHMVVQKGMPHRNVMNFFLLPSMIGRGKDAAVYIALSKSGNAAAIKWYHLRRSQKATEKEREDEKKEFLKETEMKCDEEEGRWRALYPHYPVRKVTTNGAASLLMPLGRSLDVKQYQEYLPKIEAELCRFESEGFVYKEARLQHFFLDENNNLFLADLGSLEKVEDDNERSERLKHHIEALRKRHRDRLKENSENSTPGGMKRKRAEGDSFGEKKPRAVTGV